MSNTDQGAPPPPSNPWGFGGTNPWGFSGLQRLAQQAMPALPVGREPYIPATSSRPPSEQGQGEASPEQGDSNMQVSAADIPGLVHRTTTGFGRYGSPQTAMASIAAGHAATGYWQAFAAGQQARMSLEYNKWKLATAQAQERQKQESNELREILSVYGANESTPGNEANFERAINEYAARHPDDWVLNNYLKQGGPAAADQLLKHRDSLFLDQGKIIQAQEAAARLRNIELKNKALEEQQTNDNNLDDAAKSIGLPAIGKGGGGDSPATSTEQDRDEGDTTRDDDTTPQPAQDDGTQQPQPVQQDEDTSPVPHGSDPPPNPLPMRGGQAASPNQTAAATPAPAAKPSAGTGLGLTTPAAAAEAPSPRTDQPPPQTVAPTTQPPTTTTHTITGPDGDPIQVTAKTPQAGDNAGPGGEKVNTKPPDDRLIRSRRPPPVPSNIMDGITLPPEKKYPDVFQMRPGEATAEAMDWIYSGAPKTGNRKLTRLEQYQRKIVEMRRQEIQDYIKKIEERTSATRTNKGGFLNRSDYAAISRALYAADRGLAADFDAIRTNNRPLATSAYGVRNPYTRWMGQVVSDLTGNHYNSARYQLALSAARQFNNGTGQVAQSRIYADTALQHLAELQKLGRDIDNFHSLHPGAPIENIMKTFIEKHFYGVPGINNYDTAVTMVADEVERAFRSTGGTQAGIYEHLKSLSVALTPEEKDGAIRVTANYLTARLNSIADQYNKAVYAYDESGRPDPDNDLYRRPIDMLSTAARGALDDIFAGDMGHYPQGLY